MIILEVFLYFYHTVSKMKRNIITAVLSLTLSLNAISAGVNNNNTGNNTNNTVNTGINTNTSAASVRNNNCKFIEGSDPYLKRVIEKVQKERRTGDLLCDPDGEKMAYYIIENEEYNINLGVELIITQATTNDNFKKEFQKKFNDYKNFYKGINKRNLGNTPLPDKEVIRFYARIANTDNFFMIGKYVSDPNSNVNIFIASYGSKNLFDKIGFFEEIEKEVIVRYDNITF